jgi:hypothetical protein
VELVPVLIPVPVLVLLVVLKLVSSARPYELVRDENENGHRDEDKLKGFLILVQEVANNEVITIG